MHSTNKTIILLSLIAVRKQLSTTNNLFVLKSCYLEKNFSRVLLKIIDKNLKKRLLLKLGMYSGCSIFQCNLSLQKSLPQDFCKKNVLIQF